MVDGEKEKLMSFEDSRVWQASVELALEVYGLLKKFPNEELYAMNSQLRRAVVSISTNIAEGFGRRGVKEKIQFYSISYGSLLEVRSLLLVAEKLGYIDQSVQETVMMKITSLQKQINALKRSLA
jgi:four helix bundle protein